MIGGDEKCALSRNGHGDNFAEARINCFYRSHGCGEYSCVPNHVAVREVDDDEVVFLGIDGGDHGIFNALRTHLRLEIVGCDLRRRNKNPLLTWKWLLAPAVEKEGDVGVFLG